MQISFNYNLETAYVDDVWKFNKTVNEFPIRICGKDYGAKTLLIESINMKEIVEYYDTEQQEGKEKWRYANVAIQLLYRHETWTEHYLNVGTKIFTDNGLEEIYRWQNGEGVVNYASMTEYKNQSRDSTCPGEAISEPMFLSDEGNNISPFGGRYYRYDSVAADWKWYEGKENEQQETYISGCPFLPACWDDLLIPEENDFRYW